MSAGIAAQAIGQGFELGANIAQMVPTWGERKDKKLVKKDVAAMEGGSLGLSNAERQQAVQRAMQMAGQQAGQMQTQISRDSLADRGSRDMGMYANAQRLVGQQATEAGAQAAAQTDSLSAQLAEARRQEVLGRLQQRVETGMQRQKMAVDGAKNIGKQFQNLGGNMMMGGMKAGGGALGGGAG